MVHGHGYRRIAGLAHTIITVQSLWYIKLVTTGVPVTCTSYCTSAHEPNSAPPCNPDIVDDAESNGRVTLRRAGTMVRMAAGYFMVVAVIITQRSWSCARPLARCFRYPYALYTRCELTISIDRYDYDPPTRFEARSSARGETAFSWQKVDSFYSNRPFQKH